MISANPNPQTHAERLARAQQIAAQLQAHFGDELLALGVYGSLARGTDGPYSDIEMWCILRGEEIDYAYEWTPGPWKAEVDVRSLDTIQHEAADLDEDWAMTHGSFAHVLPLYDPEGIFPTLAERVFAHADTEFEALIHAVIVGEIYELVGKIRNLSAVYAETLPPSLPLYIVSLARYSVWLVGLANRRLYTTTSVMFAESLTFSDYPTEYAELCEVVMSGRLSEPERLYEVVEKFWAGVKRWATVRGLEINQTLEHLLLHPTYTQHG
ncbi:MAG: nucleotidyltransferase [Anaerolineales bacterium]|nr:nucleotidyltransferase [Anaerolineales bacterium]